MATTQRRVIGILLVAGCALVSESSPALGFALSSTTGTGFADLTASPKDYYSWGNPADDVTTITYKFLPSFFVDPDPSKERFRDQVRLAFDQWSSAGSTPPGNIYSYFRAVSQPVGDLRSLAVHEIGHLLGFDHPDEAHQAGRNYRYSGGNLVPMAPVSSEVMRSTLQPGNYNHILSHDELEAYKHVYGIKKKVLFVEVGVNDPADITIGALPLGGNLLWAQGNITLAVPRPGDPSQGQQAKHAEIIFNSTLVGPAGTPMEKKNPIGFIAKKVNWDYKNKSGKRVASLDIRTRGTNNPNPFWHYDGFPGQKFNYLGPYDWDDPGFPSAPDASAKDDLMHQWQWPGPAAAAPLEPHVGLDQDVYDWSVVAATARFTDNTSDHQASLVSPEPWQYTELTVAVSKSAQDGVLPAESSAVDQGQRMLAEVVRARGFKVGAPEMDVTFEITVLGMADVQGDNLTLAQLNRVTLQQLIGQGRFIDLTPYVPASQQFLGYQDEFFVVLDGDVADLPQEIVDAGNYLIYAAPELLDGELFVFVEAESDTSVVGTHALLGEQLDRGPGPELAGAFAFGSRMLNCPTFSNPVVDYTMVHHGTPADLEYDPNRGWGYEVTYLVDSPHGDRSGYGIFGPFDDSPNSRDKFADECPEELYDSFIGAKDFTNECSGAAIGDPCAPCAPTIDPEGIIFRVDVPNGMYRFVGAFGEADNVHAHRIVAEDGGSGPPEMIGPNHVVLVSNFDQAQYAIGEADLAQPGEGVFARVGFDDKVPPPGDDESPSPQFVNMDEHGLATDGFPTSPTLRVTQGYIRIHQLQGNSNDGPGGPRDGNGGDIVILELWKVGPQLPEPIVLLAEDFEGLTLGPNVDEALVGEAVWTDTPPEGWIIDESGVPGIGDPNTDGVTEWAGWAFADKAWWTETAGDQNRSQFELGRGTVAVADPDEWDDADHPGPNSEDPYDTWLATPAIDISGCEAGTVRLKFDSSWRPEFDDNYHQTANITASFDGAEPIEVLRWESDSGSPNFKPDTTNETVIVDLGNPEGATSVVLTFGLFDAGNDWWWAIDNVEVVGALPIPLP